MITIIVTALVLVYKSSCNTDVYVFMVMQIKLVAVVVVLLVCMSNWCPFEIT